MQKKERNSNIEALRVFMMFLIILLHFSARVYDLKDTDNYPAFTFSILQSIRSFCFLGVSTFAFISGYYGINWSLNKFLKLEFLAISWGVGIYIVGALMGGMPSPKILFPLCSGYIWYFSAYMILMILSPIINTGIKNVEKKTHQTIVIFLVCFFYGGQFIFPDSIGQNFLILVVIYILASYLHKYPNQNLEKNALYYFLLAVLLNATIAFTASNYLDHTANNLPSKLFSKFATNNNPLVIFASINLFLFTKNLKKHPFKFLSKLAPYMLATYIMHGFILSMQKVENFLHKESLLFLIFSSILALIVCSILEKIRQLLTGKLENNIINHLTKQDQQIN